MKQTEECFLKVKKDYLNFLNKEKISDKSMKKKISRLMMVRIILSIKKNEKNRRLFFKSKRRLSKVFE